MTELGKGKIRKGRDRRKREKPSRCILGVLATCQASFGDVYVYYFNDEVVTMPFFT